MSLDGQVLWKRREMGEPWARLTAGNPSAAAPPEVAPAMKRRREEVGCCMACCLRSGLHEPACCEQLVGQHEARTKRNAWCGAAGCGAGSANMGRLRIKPC